MKTVEQTTCLFCSKSFVQTHGSQRYCGAKCRRGAEFEIKRINARLEPLERERMVEEMRNLNPSALNDGEGRTPADLLQASNRQIQTERQRLLEILD